MKNALPAGFITSYAQGFFLLSAASEVMNYNLDNGRIAAIWCGGCIIRSILLDKIMHTYQKNPKLEHLIEDPDLSAQAVRLQHGLRNMVQTAPSMGIPAPGRMSILSYFDSLRSSWLPANLIQAQRDYFGSHQYQRTDKKGKFHTEWIK